MKKELFNWIRLLLIAASLLAFLIFVNCYFDPANLYHDVSKPLAVALMDGDSAYITSGNANERLVKQYMIENMPKQPECLLIGSSTVLGIRREHVGTESFYNLGVSSADFYDIMSQFALLEINDIKPQKIILGVDHYFFSESLYESLVRSKPWRPYAEYMMKKLDGNPMPIPEADTKAEQIERFRQMFSITYFQASVDYVKENGSLRIKRWGVADAEYEGAYFAPDGSMVYPKGYENTPVEEVLKQVAGYDMEYQFGSYRHISERSTEYFEKLIQYLTEGGVEVELFLCPMSPALWELCAAEKYPMLTEIEKLVHEMAQKYDLEVEGTYNPHTLQMSNDAFYDARHVRHKLIEKYFKFF